MKIRRYSVQAGSSMNIQLDLPANSVGDSMLADILQEVAAKLPAQPGYIRLQVECVHEYDTAAIVDGYLG